MMKPIRLLCIEKSSNHVHAVDAPPTATYSLAFTLVAEGEAPAADFEVEEVPKDVWDRYETGGVYQVVPWQEGEDT